MKYNLFLLTNLWCGTCEILCLENCNAICMDVKDMVQQNVFSDTLFAEKSFGGLVIGADALVFDRLSGVYHWHV